MNILTPTAASSAWKKRPEPRSGSDRAPHYIPLSQSLCSRCQGILQKLETMSAQQPRELTGYIPVSSLQRLGCGICQVVSYAYEKLAAWERPESRKSPSYDRNIRILYGRNYFEVVTFFYIWYGALSTIHGIRISCALGMLLPQSWSPVRVAQPIRYRNSVPLANVPINTHF